MAIELQPGVPILRIFDIERAKQFYVDWLGMTIDFEHRFDDDSPLYLHLLDPFGNVLRIEERVETD